MTVASAVDSAAQVLAETWAEGGLSGSSTVDGPLTATPVDMLRAAAGSLLRSAERMEAGDLPRRARNRVVHRAAAVYAAAVDVEQMLGASGGGR